MKKTVTFGQPVTIGGKEYKEIEMREPTVQDMLDIEELSGSDLEKEIEMIGRLTGLCGEDLKPLGAGPYRSMQKVYVSFLE